METLPSSSMGTPPPPDTGCVRRDVRSLRRQVRRPTRWWLLRMTQQSVCRQPLYFHCVGSWTFNGLMTWCNYVHQKVSMCRLSLRHFNNVRLIRVMILVFYFWLGCYVIIIVIIFIFILLYLCCASMTLSYRG